MRNGRDLRNAVIHTLAFFWIYNLPVHRRRLFELLYKCRAKENEVYWELEKMVVEKQIIRRGDLYSLDHWDNEHFRQNLEESDKRWKKVYLYAWILSILPFLEYVAVINSLAIGSADKESDIDFFVITKSDCLYFCRSLIIVVFKLLNIYKTRIHVRERFSFGYYITTKHLDLSELTLYDDPYLAFWFASHAPIIGLNIYKQFTKSNTWIYKYFPNYDSSFREKYFYKERRSIIKLKTILEKLLSIPVTLFEPLIRYIHVRHTFNLPENHWPTSSTIADKNILKLHAIDNRKDLRKMFYEILAKSGKVIQ